METKFWRKLDDQQAEKACGGASQFVTSTNNYLYDWNGDGAANASDAIFILSTDFNGGRKINIPGKFVNDPSKSSINIYTETYEYEGNTYTETLFSFQYSVNQQGKATLL